MAFKLKAQVGLRTIFLIFVCAAIGLAVGMAPRPTSITAPGGFIVTPQRSWSDALLAGVSAAILIGLAQQACLLVRAKSSETQPVSSFSRPFGVMWRVLVGATLVICLVVKVLITRGYVSYPASEAMLMFEPFPQVVWLTCVIVALSATATRWRSPTAKRLRNRLWIIVAWLAGVVLAVIVYSDITLVQFLVHVAAAGIHSAQAPHVIRQGVFPNHLIEGFRSFWLSAAATGCVVFAAATLAALNNGRRKQSLVRRILSIVFVASLAAAAAYVIWFHHSEYRRISPDFASVGIAANWVELLGGALLCVILLTAGAYVLSCCKNQTTDNAFVVTASRVFFHESPFVMFSVLIIVVIDTFSLFDSISSLRMRLGDFVLIIFQRIMTYLMLALAMLALHICRLRWLRRGEEVPWRLLPLDGRRYAWNWLALAVLATVGIPTLSAFSFVMWLGPWWMIGR